MNLMKKFKSKKVLAMSLALCLVLCTIIGGTVAWLIDDTDPVVNTFTYGDINITLTETDTNDGDNNPNTNEYKMMPGQTIAKDPKVTVLKDSENCWLFVKLEKSADFDTFMTYSVILDDTTTGVIEGWAALDGVAGVYYRKVDKPASDTPFDVIEGNTVTVKGEVTKEMLYALTDYPTLTITAYAVQRDSNVATAADAWAKIPATTP